MYNNGTGNDGTYNLGLNNTGNFNRGISNNGDGNQGKLITLRCDYCIASTCCCIWLKPCTENCPRAGTYNAGQVNAGNSNNGVGNTGNYNNGKL